MTIFLPHGSASRQHLMISYAIENGTFAMWLSRRLAAEGYLIWFDKLKLLGGQEWPKEINTAIRERSFLMLALMSGASVKKPNPTGEWTLGLGVARDLKRDFVVPLRVDKFDYKDLGFLHINRQYVDFSDSWSAGFKDLLNTLDALHAPKVAADGRSVSARTFMPDRMVVVRPERLVSNLIKFESLPPHVLQFSSSRPATDDEWAVLKKKWAFRALKGCRFLAIGRPPIEFVGDLFKQDPSPLTWEQVKTVHDIDSTAFFSEMLRKTVMSILLTKGFLLEDDERSVYLDPAAFQGNRINFTRPDGSRGWVGVKGRRTFRIGKDLRQAVEYNLGFRIAIEDLPSVGWALIPKLFLRLRAEGGMKLADRTAMGRRRAITRDWWNDKQLSTHIAFLVALALAQDAAAAAGLDLQAKLAPAPVSFAIDKGIDETRFGRPDDEVDESTTPEIEDPDDNDETEAAP